MVARPVVEQGQAVGEWGAGGGRRGEPVGELGHVVRGVGEDVQEAAGAPGLELGEQAGEGGRGVQAQDGVGDVELVLLDRLLGEVVGGEVAVKVREAGRELEGLIVQAGGR